MLRSSQHLYRRALARPIGQPMSRATPPTASCFHPIIPPRARSRALLQDPRPRHFTISHLRLAEQLPRLPQEPEPSAAAAADAAVPQPPQSPSKPQRRRRRRRRRRGLLYAALFLLLGTTAGTLTRLTIVPPALPAPGSAEDAYLQSQIQARGAALPLVRQLSADPAWTSWDAYSGIAVAQARLTSGPMAGSSGLAFQRVFHHAATGEVVSVVYFGAGLAGWPGVVHGGALATVLDESLGRCALLRFPSRTGVTANLELQYRAPTLTNEFYVVRARPVLSADDEQAVGPDGTRKSDRKLWVRGTLETERGKTCVEGKGLFVVPKGFQLRPLVEGY
ncbi:hypothetical protein F5Y19DRAFT_335581 [Xylariaceae sp. FL1651]|nr:hypothetical protein F5Y19DRAFT_335581 [Xylariaceae sp. FL1651]